MPKQKDTKLLILDAALNLFSKRGYDGVGLRDLAQEVGIRESAIYKHFKGKQDIFDSLLEQMNNEYNAFAMSINVQSDLSKMIDKYKTISENDLIMICNSFFMYFAKDERASKFRKILTMEQFRNKEIGLLYKTLYFDNVLAYHTEIFKGLIAAGTIIDVSPEIVALHFYSPIFVLLTSFDEQKISELDVMKKLELHVKQFRTIYYKEQLL
jgi:transcriptional regulator, tetR family